MDIRHYSKNDYAFVKQLYISALTENSGKAVKDVLLQPRTTRILSLVIPIAGYLIYQGLAHIMQWEPLMAYQYTMAAVIFLFFMLIGSTYQMFSAGIKKSVKASFERDMADVSTTFDLTTKDDGESYEPTSVSNVWIATVNGETAGFLTLYQNGSKTCEIRKLAVQRKFRRRGLGEMMTRRAILWAKDHHIKKVFALNVSSAQVAACELFEKCNFVISKQKPVIQGFGYVAYELAQ
jgi:N-acetylglutamate synthase-like GNAT family acetyltransferase